MYSWQKYLSHQDVACHDIW